MQHILSFEKLEKNLVRQKIDNAFFILSLMVAKKSLEKITLMIG
jgi:hypothetical protein